MFAFTEEQIYALQARPTNIRNISMIAQVDHGKSTLMDAIVPEAFMVTQSRKVKMPREWFQQDEEERIKQTAFPLYFKTESEELSAIEQRTDGPEFLINLIDFPYHADLSSEVATALRVTDGALVVIDCVEGFGMQTETVLRQALMERVKPVLVINKVDHLLLNHRISKEDLFQSFSQAIESFNVIVSTYPDPALGDIQVHPEKGTVAFGSGLHGWAFTLRQFATRYSQRFGVDKEKMMKRLWGDNYFDSITKKWTTKATSADGKPLERAFNMFVLEPIFKILDAVMDPKKENIRTILEKLSIDLILDEYDLEGRSLLKVVMRKFLPAREALLEMIVFHLPSPVTAQRYRVETLYEGPMDDESAVGIRNCDPKGPLIIYVSKMVPVTTTGGYSNERRAGYTKQFYALGRVFSGSVKSGLKIRILGPNYVHGKKEDLFIKSIQRIVLMTGRYVEPIEECLAGNIIGLAGIDQFLLTSGTITSSETAHNIKVMKFSTSPVVQIAVDVKSVADLPKLIEGLRRLSKSDPCVQTWIGGTGEHIVAGTSEAHLEICLKDLEEDHAGVPMKKSDPGVSYRETVRAESSMTALSKSQNLHNRLYVKALPIGEEATLAIETGKFRAHDDFNVRARILADEFGWDIADARKIWTFGPDATGPNVFVDLTKGVQHLNEIKDSCVAAFKWITRESVCAEENMRGIRFNLLDVTMSGDAISRGDGQIMAPCRRVCNAACLLADPTLLEPIYLVEIECPINVISSVHSVLNNRRGQVFSEEQRPGVPMLTVKAYLPVVEAFGFTTDLQSHTQGQAFAHCVFDHWESIPGSVFDKGSKVEEVVRGIRIRKGLQVAISRTLELLLMVNQPDIPSLDKYYDKL